MHHALWFTFTNDFPSLRILPMHDMLRHEEPLPDGISSDLGGDEGKYTGFHRFIYRSISTLITSARKVQSAPLRGRSNMAFRSVLSGGTGIILRSLTSRSRTLPGGVRRVWRGITDSHSYRNIVHCRYNPNEIDRVPRNPCRASAIPYENCSIS